MSNKSSDSVAVPGKQSRNERIEEFLREHYAFRYNTVKSRAEFRSSDGEFLPVTKYRLNSFRLHSVAVKKSDTRVGRNGRRPTHST